MLQCQHYFVHLKYILLVSHGVIRQVFSVVKELFVHTEVLLFVSAMFCFPSFTSNLLAIFVKIRFF